MGTANLSTTAQEIFPENKLRKSHIIQNTDAAINIFVQFRRIGTGAVVSSTNFDHRIGPGGSLALNSDIDGIESIQNRIEGIAASGTPLISFFETEDKRR